jgi:hypothetical protein
VTSSAWSWYQNVAAALVVVGIVIVAEAARHDEVGGEAVGGRGRVGAVQVDDRRVGQVVVVADGQRLAAAGADRRPG